MAPEPGVSSADELDLEAVMEEIRLRAASVAPLPLVAEPFGSRHVELLAGSTDTYHVPLTFGRGVLNPIVRAVAAILRRFLTPSLMAQVHHNERMLLALRGLARTQAELRGRLDDVQRDLDTQAARSREAGALRSAWEQEVLRAIEERVASSQAVAEQALHAATESARGLGDVRTSTERLLSEARDAREALARSHESRVAALAESVRALVARLEELSRDAALDRSRVGLLLRDSRRAARGGAAHADDGDRSARPAAAATEAGDLDDTEYLRFEDRFRGSREEIRARQQEYVDLFGERYGPAAWADRPSQPPILDIGCGRGEFLELMAARGIAARGVDQSAAMVESCRARGLDVTLEDALVHLRSLSDGVLGGVFCSHVVEHLPAADLVELVRLCRQKIRPGGVAVFETVNPRNLVASAVNFYLDLSHVRQVHPLTLQFLAESAGFTRTEIRDLSPIPAEAKLQRVPANDPASAVLNANVDRLNDVLFGPRDYALVAEA